MTSTAPKTMARMPISTTSAVSGRAGVPDAEEADGDGDDPPDEVGPPVGQVVQSDGVDDVEDPEDEEGPPDQHGGDEDRDVRPHEADDAHAHPDDAEDEMQPALAGDAERPDELEESPGDEEAAGEVDDGVDAGVPVTDHEEAEDHGDDPPGQVPTPHLLERRGDGITDRDVVLGECYVGHEFPLGE